MIDALSDGEHLSEYTLLNSLHALLECRSGFVIKTAQDEWAGRCSPRFAEPVERHRRVFGYHIFLLLIAYCYVGNEIDRSRLT